MWANALLRYSGPWPSWITMPCSDPSARMRKRASASARRRSGVVRSSTAGPTTFIGPAVPSRLAVAQGADGLGDTRRLDRLQEKAGDPGLAGQPLGRAVAEAGAQDDRAERPDLV